MRRTFSFQGFVIGQKEWQEGDKIITLLTKKRGKLVVFAKGVRRIKSRRGGLLETGNLIKGKISKNKDVFFLGEIELIFQPQELRKSLVLGGGLLFICQLVNNLLPEGEENLRVYQLFEQTVRGLIKEKRVEILVLFEVQLLNILGFGIPEGIMNLIRKKDWRRAQGEIRKYLGTILERKVNDLDIFLN